MIALREDAETGELSLTSVRLPRWGEPEGSAVEGGPAGALPFVKNRKRGREADPGADPKREGPAYKRKAEGAAGPKHRIRAAVLHVGAAPQQHHHHQHHRRQVPSRAIDPRKDATRWGEKELFLT